MGVFDQKWTQEDADQARDMWVSGHSATQISTIVGKSRSAVISKMNRIHAASPLARIPATNVRQATLEPEVPVPSLHPVTLAKLSRNHCRAILAASSAEGSILYCGDPKVAGSSYCQFHRDQYTRPPEERKSSGQTSQRQ